MENTPQPQYRRISPEVQDDYDIAHDELILLGEKATPVTIATQLNEMLTDKEFQELVGWVYEMGEDKTAAK